MILGNSPNFFVIYFLKCNVVKAGLYGFQGIFQFLRFYNFIGLYISNAFKPLNMPYCIG